MLIMWAKFQWHCNSLVVRGNLRNLKLNQPHLPQEAHQLNYVNLWYNAALLVVCKQFNTIIMNA